MVTNLRAVTARKRFFRKFTETYDKPHCITGRVVSVTDQENGDEKKPRAKRDTIMPVTLSGWSVLLVAIICATGVALVALGEKALALDIFKSSGWAGFLTMLMGRKKAS